MMTNINAIAVKFDCKIKYKNNTTLGKLNFIWHVNGTHVLQNIMMIQCKYRTASADI